MKAALSYRSTTVVFNIEDGPVIGSAPMRLRQGKFKVERLSLTYHNGELKQAFVRGRNILPSGEYGRIMMDRTLLLNEFPGWLSEFVQQDWNSTTNR